MVACRVPISFGDFRRKTRDAFKDEQVNSAAAPAAYKCAVRIKPCRVAQSFRIRPLGLLCEHQDLCRALV